MNNKQFPFSEDDARLDRLVDGELSDAEYREVLAALEGDPDGWRRCALAFLEAQALGREISAVQREIEAVPARLMESEPVEREAALPRSFNWKLLLATAASLLVAFGLGFAVRGWPHPAGLSGRTQPLIVEGAPSHATGRSDSSAEEAPSVKRPAGPLGNVTLVVDGENGPQGQPISLPVYDAEQAEQRLSFEKTALPADVRAMLERMGNRIEERQQLVTVELQDGRQVVVPVEQYRIVPVSHRPY